MKTIMSVQWLAVMCLGVLACTVQEDVSSAARGKLDLTEEEINLLTQASHQKARALGYNLDELTFSLTKEGETYKAFYLPKRKGALGGDLTIYLDRTGSVLRFIRGV